MGARPGQGWGAPAAGPVLIPVPAKSVVGRRGNTPSACRCESPARSGSTGCVQPEINALRSACFPPAERFSAPADINGEAARADGCGRGGRRYRGQRQAEKKKPAMLLEDNMPANFPMEAESTVNVG